MKRVLIVDDELDVLEALEGIVELEGYEVRTAVDGQAGLEQALEEPPDLLILDVMMPRLSGLEVVQNLRERGQLPPTILISAVKPQVRGSAAAWSTFLLKPFNVDGLLEAIARLIGPGEPPA